MAVLQRATVKPADSIFIFNFAVANFTMAKRVGAHGVPHLINGGDCGFLEGILLKQARSDLAKQQLHVESFNKYIGELQRQTEEQRLA